MRRGFDPADAGLGGQAPIPVISSTEIHMSARKCLATLGLGRSSLTMIPATAGKVDLQALEAALAGTAGACIVVANAGEVNTGAFDPLNEIADLCDAHPGGAWLHVDGAFGLFARLLDEHAHKLAGVERANSVAVDAHKWLNVPYDSGAALVRDREALVRAMSISGAYLVASSDLTAGTGRDAMTVTPDSSRRARAVEVWAALKSLGRSGLAELIGRNCRQARRMAEALRGGGAEILNEVVLNQVVVAFGNDERTRRVVAMVQQNGECWCGGTTWQGRAAMRVSVSSWATSDADIDRAAAAILAAARAV
jgi:glutamate/tyrosine decarboxylase-like PLP-dependent enzyme